MQEARVYFTTETNGVFKVSCEYQDSRPPVLATHFKETGSWAKHPSAVKADGEQFGGPSVSNQRLYTCALAFAHGLQRGTAEACPELLACFTQRKYQLRLFKVCSDTKIASKSDVRMKLRARSLHRGDVAGY